MLLRLVPTVERLLLSMNLNWSRKREKIFFFFFFFFFYIYICCSISNVYHLVLGLPAVNMLSSYASTKVTDPLSNSDGVESLMSSVGRDICDDSNEFHPDSDVSRVGVRNKRRHVVGLESCHHCGDFQTSVKYLFEAHVDVCSRRQFNCRDCQGRFTTSSGLKLHQAAHCSSERLRVYWDTFFGSVGFWAARSYVYPYRFFCLICGEFSSGRLPALRAHLIQHLVRPIGRSACAARGCEVGTKEDYQRHLLLDCTARVGAYFCPFCGKGYNDKSVFGSHLVACATTMIKSGFELPAPISSPCRKVPKPVNLDGSFRVKCSFCEDEEFTNIDYFCHHIVNCTRIEKYPMYPRYMSIDDFFGFRYFQEYCHLMELFKCSHCKLFMSHVPRTVKRHFALCIKSGNESE